MERAAKDMSAMAKFIRYFRKSADDLFFLFNIMIAKILEMIAIKAVPPYNIAKHVWNGSGNASKSDNFKVVLVIDVFNRLFF